MALNDEIRREQAKLKGQPFKVKFAYFWDYYKIHTIVAFCIIVAVAWTAYDMITAKDTAVGAYFLNAAGAVEELAAAYMREFEQAYGVDTAKEEVYLSTTQYLTPGANRDNYDYAALQKIVAEQAAGEMDFTAMDLWNFNSYVQSGMFADLREIFSEEELARMDEKYGLYYVDMQEIREEAERREDVEYITKMEVESTAEANESELLSNFTLPDPSGMRDPAPVGVWINSTELVTEAHFYDGITAIGGIVVNTKRMEPAKAFFQWLLFGAEAIARQ